MAFSGRLMLYGICAADLVQDMERTAEVSTQVSLILLRGDSLMLALIPRYGRQLNGHGLGL